jgi:outer membrane lipoprotein SlyB
MNLSNTFPSSVSSASLGSPSVSANAAPTIKALWIAIAFLSLCVLAIGGTLIRQQPSAATGLVPLTGAQAMLAPQSLTGINSKANAMITERKDGSPIDSPAPASTKKTVTTTERSAKAPVRVAQASGNSNSTAPAASCTSCGTVEAVTPFTRPGQGSGVGMVGGAVVGGVLGNQVGKGSGRAVATVLGAAGGGWAGNTIEKNMKKTTAYSVRVRMQDGSSRTIEQNAAPMVGAKVTVDGGTLRPA